ncbi:MAG: type II toxin-antitoxin system HicB family antitoxin [Bacteroidales bacterium]|nr:type II toxin-antitoxin system HicB family antitoxin [Bacteroidales bacterium]
MNTKEFVYWQDDDIWLGYLKEYPDYWTQGETFEELKENLKDIFIDLVSGVIPNIRKTGELEIA